MDVTVNRAITSGCGVNMAGLRAGSTTAGARFDDNDDFGQHTLAGQPASNSAGRPDPGGKGAIGTGFRAPSPSKFHNSGPFSFPASEISL